MGVAEDMRKAWPHRLMIYPATGIPGLFVVLERYIECTYLVPGQKIGGWVEVAGFPICGSNITSRELWEQVYIYTGFFGEKVPEA